LVDNPKDRLILDRDVPKEREKLRLGINPLDNDEVTKFTLEAELERLTKELDSNTKFSDRRAASAEIMRLMKQAEEDKDKLSPRGIAAFDYLNSKKEMWNT
jgi:hypothetical protein